MCEKLVFWKHLSCWFRGGFDSQNSNSRFLLNCIQQKHLRMSLNQRLFSLDLSSLRGTEGRFLKDTLSLKVFSLTNIFVKLSELSNDTWSVCQVPSYKLTTNLIVLNSYTKVNMTNSNFSHMSFCKMYPHKFYKLKSKLLQSTREIKFKSKWNESLVCFT